MEIVICIKISSAVTYTFDDSMRTSLRITIYNMDAYEHATKKLRTN